jgi:hypothetical protein
MSTYETYEYERGPFQPGLYETGYEMYEDEDEAFLAEILSNVTGSPRPGFAGAPRPWASSPLSATQEMELTAELLEIASEEELETFFRNVADGVAQSIGNTIGPERAYALGRVLTSFAKSALPVATGAVGATLGTMAVGPATPFLGPAAANLPKVGWNVGVATGTGMTKAMGLELEGMTQEQAEFETGRRLLRMAATAATHAAKAPRNVPAKKVARVAITKAVRQHAPGLLSGAGGGPRGRQPRHPRPGARQPAGGRPPGAAAFPDGHAPDDAGGGRGPEDDPSGGQPTAPDWDEPGANGDGPEGTGPGGHSGRWIRHDGNIVLLGT